MSKSKKTAASKKAPSVKKRPTQVDSPTATTDTAVAPQEATQAPTKAKRTPKAPKAPKPAKEKKLSLLDAAAVVLKAKGEPMQVRPIVDEVKAKGLWTSTAPTPHATLYSAILREIAVKKGDSRFKKTDRGHFALNA